MPYCMLMGEDGRHITIGRHGVTEADIARAETALQAAGLSGWVVESDRGFYDRGRPTITVTRTVGAPSVAPADAIKAFLALRRQAHKRTGA